MIRITGPYGRTRLKKSERRQQIQLELKLHPHVRISTLADRFGVSTETIRRDFDNLSEDGLICRAHGGASAPVQGRFPSLDERSTARIVERERIGRAAAKLVRDGETVMIDSGSTTIQMARSLAYFGTRCTVITNSVPVAITLGHGATKVLLCPGEYLPAESALVGDDTVKYLKRFNVDRCMIGASGLSTEGPSECVRGFAAIKRTMLSRSEQSHLLIDSEKFERKGLSRVGKLKRFDSIVADREPRSKLANALKSAHVELLLAS
ncbi:MAG: DeoR/GlpR family DNA-binding transcription regulator [Albidovulum sp.]|nr:DeoR/GlpR family DNA-binding transcription regulator [Albidovulum sp.]MDE0308190.1 DeoR/GlpR family DNA-binding transcription regulator [Albidovulum sp.]